jgi:photosystem II stability/assembly factor-like uncharacterized protein
MMRGNFLVRACLLGLLAVSGAAYAATGAAPPVTQAMQLRTPQNAPLVAVSSSGRDWFAVGDYGTVIRSSDNGATWKQAQSVPYSGLLTAVAMADEQVGWAVGHGGTILHTGDGGQRWSLQKQVDGAPVLLSLVALDKRHALVVGAYGTALATADGGQSWMPVRVGEGRDADRHLNHVFVANGVTYIAAESGKAYRAKNGWAAWEQLNTGVSGSLWGGLATRDGAVVLFGMSGRLIVSRDQGASWESVDTGLSQSLTHGVQLPDGRLVVVGNGGAMIVGSPAAQAFKASVLADRRNISAVAAHAKEGLALFGTFGVVKQAPPN